MGEERARMLGGMNHLIMTRHLKFLAGVAAIALIAAPQAFAQAPSSNQNILRVQLSGFRSNNGKPHCTIYNDAAAFPSHDEKALKESEAPAIANSQAEVDFAGLAPGKYALVCFHDENNNGKFDENALGMPKEGYCFSNNIHPRFSAPTFEQCAFDYQGGDQSIAITMIYLY
jgi:uncharacterized protein (DUF2141 family)